VVLTVFVPESEFKPLILTVTYIVVLFSIIVQGLTVAPMARRVSDNPDPR
jgi:CPA1 family monovalent cation:H+ antiporter